MADAFDAALSPGAVDSLTAAVALQPAIRAASNQIEQERRLPPELVRKLKQAGVFRMTMPRNWGGAELVTLCRNCECSKSYHTPTARSVGARQSAAIPAT